MTETTWTLHLGVKTHGRLSVEPRLLGALGAAMAHEYLGQSEGEPQLETLARACRATMQGDFSIVMDPSPAGAAFLRRLGELALRDGARIVECARAAAEGITESAVVHYRDHQVACHVLASLCAEIADRMEGLFEEAEQ